MLTMSKYIRNLVRQARESLLSDTELCVNGRRLADEIEAMLNRGWPEEGPDIRNAVTELNGVLEAVVEQRRKHNTRVNMGILVSQSRVYKETVDHINQTVDDPEMRAYFIEKISCGESYEVPIHSRHGFQKEYYFDE